MNKTYNFSTKEYVKMSFAKYLIVWVLLNLFFIFTFGIVGVFNPISCFIIVILSTVLTSIVFLKMMNVRRLSNIQICNDLLILHFVNKHKTSKNKINSIYEENIYTTRNINNYNIHKHYIQIFGDVKLMKVRDRGYSHHDKHSSALTCNIPFMFEKREEMIKDIHLLIKQAN